MNPDKLREILIDHFGEGHEYKNGQFRVDCISPDCDDHSQNLEINVDQGIFHCWKCGYSGRVRKLFRDMLGKEIDVEEEFISAESLRKFTLDFGDKKEESSKIFPGLPSEFKPLWEPNLSLTGQQALRYVLTRMTMEDIERYRVGYCGLGEYKGRVIVPVFEKGKVIYFIGRAISKGPPPYKNSKFPRAEIIFNYEKAIETRRGGLVEGVFDAIRIGDGPVAGIAALGTSITEEQIYKLNDIPDLTIMLDNDAKLKTFSLRNLLAGLQRPPKISILPHGDPDNFQRKELQEMFEKAKAPSFEDSISALMS